MLKDPELIKSVAMKNFDTNEQLFSKNLIALKGDLWREIRAILSPSVP